MTKNRHRRRSRKNDRGSALLVSLMVIVGLSLLGLGFVAISEVESKIAKNEAQALQTLTVAEAGAKLVVEWFQDPLWANGTAGMPGNATCAGFGVAPCSASGSPGTQMKTVRTVGSYVGVYKPRGTPLFDKPYRPAEDDRLYGNEQNADIIINKDTVSQAQMDTFNNILLGPNASDKDAGEVTDIRVFAPPIVGGTLTNGFWIGGTRYGVATIKVTAQQFRIPASHTDVIATHSVRVVVGELPLPIPAGPIQGNASVSFGGDFFVHWGMETSRTTLDPSRFLTSLPWANAYERPHFEHGYEPGTSVGHVTVTSGGTGYNTAPNVTIDCTGVAGCTGTGATAIPVMQGGSVIAINVDHPGSGYSRNPWEYPKVTITCSGGCSFTSAATAQAAVGHEAYFLTGSGTDTQDYFRELLGKSFDDPWYGARAAGDNLRDGPGGLPQLYPYGYQRDEKDPNSPSYFFQFQDHNSYPDYKAVVFPTIRYDYWKRIAQQGKGYKGLYYFKFDKNAGAGFKKFGNGPTDDMSNWVNTVVGHGAALGPGVYFFDTVDGQNPQVLTGAARTAQLTPVESWNAANFSKQFVMQGFIYINAQSYGTTGGAHDGVDMNVNFPGEPFRDIGYPVWCTGVGVPLPAANCPAANQWAMCNDQPCRQGAGDASFSCQDLQTGQTHHDGKCRIVVFKAPAWNSYDPALTANPAGGASGGVFVPKTWKSVEEAKKEYGHECVAPPANWDGTQPAGDYCSEPHEPYLNLIYPNVARLSNNSPAPVTVGWEDPATQTYRPKKLIDSSPWPPGTPVSCSQNGPNDPGDCVSNNYDVDGAIVTLPLILYGILYNEGQYGGQGNVDYFGSVLIQDIVAATGTADVWFDEKLIKGSWAPPRMPRVIVFSEQTDEQQQ